MSTFEVEKEAFLRLGPWLASNFQWVHHYRMDDTHGKDMQFRGCDWHGQPVGRARAYTFELKAEVDWTGNLFWETVSNAYTKRAGWGVTAIADHLVYGFLDTSRFYIGDLHKIRRFVRDHRSEFRQRDQGKTVQRNLTQGLLVPIRRLRTEGLLRNLAIRQRDATLVLPAPSGDETEWVNTVSTGAAEFLSALEARLDSRGRRWGFSRAWDLFVDVAMDCGAVPSGERVAA